VCLPAVAQSGAAALRAGCLASPATGFAQDAPPRSSAAAARRTRCSLPVPQTDRIGVDPFGGLADKKRPRRKLAGALFRRGRQTERLGGLHVDDQLELGWLLHRQIGSLLAPEYPIKIGGHLSEMLDVVDTIGGQAAVGGVKMAAGWRARRVTCEDSSWPFRGVARMANLATRTGGETCGRQILEILSGRRWSFSTAISAWLSAF
jgi:hypothetical protein